MGEHGVSAYTSLNDAHFADNFQVRHVMKSLLSEFDILMNVAGFQNIGQIDRSALGGFSIRSEG
jgi:isopentenyl diphosphate isomerase/L-lactate dehydrogenase-like FMN-dependent dehydrogenase